ncbi:MAG TPA: hypothetical protein VHR55_09045 [Candidatus Limnocylindria bacterium]|nr:hypothetical protein [Candidatus Limnocylindria bacterium]
MTASERWTCRVCWKSNHPAEPVCWKCRSPRDVADTEVERHRAAIRARAERPEAIPDIVVALPVVVYRGYARAWQRGGLGAFAIPLLLGFGGVTDIGWLLVTGGLAAGLVAGGFVAAEAADGMRDREPWAFVAGLVLSVVGAIGSVMAFETFAPSLLPSTAVRWGSLIVFGGAGLAAAAGLVLMAVRRVDEA